MIESEALQPEARYEAWQLVVDAVEAAIDRPGLDPADRAELAIFHDRAEWMLGRRPLRVIDLPRPMKSAPRPRGRSDLWRLALESGLVGKLEAAGLHDVAGVCAAMSEQPEAFVGTTVDERRAIVAATNRLVDPDGTRSARVSAELDAAGITLTQADRLRSCRIGVTEARGMTDEELLRVPRVGAGTVARLRAAAALEEHAA